MTVWGSRWRSSYDRSVAFASTGTISTAIVRRANGKQFFFNLTGSSFVGDADVVGSLVRTGVDTNGKATGWIYTNENDETENYNAAGKLVSLSNRAGQIQTLTYSDGTVGANGGYVLNAAGVTTSAILPAGRLIRVTDPAGQSIRFGYDAAGRVVKMTDPAGRDYIYGYSGSTATDNLNTVTYPDASVRTYLYGEVANVSATPNAGVNYAHVLTGLIDETGQRYASWMYDAAGHATSSEHGAIGSGIDYVRLAYGTLDAMGNATTTVTDPRGNSRSYEFSTLLGVVKNTGIAGLPCDGCSAGQTYDANGNVASRTDFNGNQTTYSYDLARNLETSRTEGLTSAGAATPATRTITTAWNTAYRLPAQVTEYDGASATGQPLRSTAYSYDTSGNLLTRTISATVNGNTVSRTWTYTYNSYGQALTSDGPRTDVSDLTTYTYYASNDADLGKRGNLATVTDALGHVTSITSYNANGRPLTIVDPNGLTTTLTYDARGRMTSRSVGGETTDYTYDGVGQLTLVTLPDNSTLAYTYDAAHRLTQVTDGLGNKIVYILDAMGNRTKEDVKDPAGTLAKTRSRVYDALNRLAQDIGAASQATGYQYDANGNLTVVTDPMNHVTSNTYDALNRLLQVTDPNNGHIQYGYDGLDHLTSVTDPRSLVTSYAYDGLDNLNQQVSPDTGITVNTYDAAGNILTRTDAKNQTTTYTYDALNRVTHIAYADASQVTYTYDQGTNGLGRLTGIVDATGSTAYAYDSHGRVVSETRTIVGVNYVTAYTYDSAGRLAQTTYPSGRTVDVTRDSIGRVSQIATTRDSVPQVLASNIAYFPFGGVKSLTFGNGSTYVRQYDQDGRISAYTLGSQTMTLGYDNASRISFATDAANPVNTKNYGYDALDRLTQYTAPTENQGYAYDADGNRTALTLGGNSYPYNYPTTSNRLTATQGPAPGKTYNYDPNGSPTTDGINQYAYDARGRLIQAVTASGTVNYAINALGQRVQKTLGSNGTVYHYDLQGHLIAESDGTGTVLQETVWLDDLPLAVMK